MPSVLGELLTILRHGPEAERRWAIGVAGALGLNNPALVTALATAAVHDPSPVVHRAAAAVLADLGAAAVPASRAPFEAARKGGGVN